MANNEQISIRLPKALLAQIDRHAELLARAAGLPLTRAAVIRRLLTIALDLERGGINSR